MKNLNKTAIAFLTTTILSTAVWAAPLSPMGMIERASHQVINLAKKNSIDRSYLSDVNTAAVKKTAQGWEVTLTSPSADAAVVNTLVVQFDAKGKAAGFSTKFTSVSAESPLYRQANAGELMDLGSEAIVDHLNESADIVRVSDTTERIELKTETDGVLLLAYLTTGEVYKIKMDFMANVISKGF